MGAWGEGPFDNDDAGDWAYDFEGADQSEGLRLLTEALDVGDDYLEAPEGAVAVAAATVVTWLRDPSSIPDSAYGEDAAAWVRASGVSPSDELRSAARRALDRVRSDDSELAELWAEADGESWRASIGELATRLG
jgi:hypothetical protein